MPRRVSRARRCPSFDWEANLFDNETVFGLVHVILGVYWFAGGRAEVHKHAAARQALGESKSVEKLET